VEDKKVVFATENMKILTIIGVIEEKTMKAITK